MDVDVEVEGGMLRRREGSSAFEGGRRVSVHSFSGTPGADGAGLRSGVVVVFLIHQQFAAEKVGWGGRVGSEEGVREG